MVKIIKLRIAIRNFILIAFFCSIFSSYSYTQSDKTYDNTTFLCTHNSFCSKGYGFFATNQSLTVTDQLEAGVRALMLDVYLCKDDVYCYHSIPATGKILLVEVLLEVKQFLKTNRNEVVTIIFESYIDANSLENCFKIANLNEFLLVLNGEKWPLISDMIADDKRLVVFSDKAENSSNNPWCNYVWDFCIETHYNNKRIKNLGNEFNRGNKCNNLVILNHFVYGCFGTGSKRNSKKINSENFLRWRIESFVAETGKYPNFIVVDFVEFGDCLKLINELNMR